MNRYEELVHEEAKDGFTVKLYLFPETEFPDWDFESEEQRKELIYDIESGRLLWFCAHVVAERKGVELGHDFLGGCCYASVSDFIKDGYYVDMVAEAIGAARLTLADLVKG